jgi:hypothetical protein
MNVVAVLAPIALLVVAACTASDSGRSASDSGRSASDDSFTLPSGRDKSFAPSGGRTVEGTLLFDDIEGGCSYLQLRDGSKLEIVYPEGWTLDRAAAVLRGPDGVVVDAGATLRVTGSVATDRSSICQVGPIFEATSVEPAG